MMLPDRDRAHVDRSKITEYLLSLSHPDGHTKAAFFMRLGFRVERWEELADALRLVGISNPVVASAQSPHGVRYTVEAIMESIKEHDRVVLTTDLPGDKLASGDVGTVVHVHRDGKAFEVEFVALDGETVAVATLERAQVRPVERREITHARRVA